MSIYAFEMKRCEMRLIITSIFIIHLFLNGNIWANDEAGSFIQKNYSKEIIEKDPVGTIQSIQKLLLTKGSVFAQKALLQWSQSLGDFSGVNLTVLEKNKLKVIETFLWAQIYDQQKKYHKAYYYYQKVFRQIKSALQVFPSSFIAKLNYYAGMNASRLGRDQLALRYLKKSLNLWHTIKEKRALFQVYYVMIELMELYDKLAKENKNYINPAIDIYIEFIKLENKNSVIADGAEFLKIYRKLMKLIDLAETKKVQLDSNQVVSLMWDYVRMATSMDSFSEIENALRHLFVYKKKRGQLKKYLEKLDQIQSNHGNQQLIYLAGKYSVLSLIQFQNYIKAYYSIRELKKDYNKFFRSDFKLQWYSFLVSYLLQKHQAVSNTLDSLAALAQNSSNNHFLSFPHQPPSFAFLKGLNCFIAYNYECSKQEFSGVLKSKAQDVLLRAKAYVYLSMIAKQKNKPEQEYKLLAKGRLLFRKHKFNEMSAFADVLKYFYDILNQQNRQIRYGYYRTMRRVRQLGLTEQYQWLFILAKFYRTNKISNDEIFKLFISYVDYAKNRAWRSMEYAFIPEDLFETATAPILDYLYKKKQIKTIITVLEYWRQRRENSYRMSLFDLLKIKKTVVDNDGLLYDQKWHNYLYSQMQLQKFRGDYVSRRALLRSIWLQKRNLYKLQYQLNIKAKKNQQNLNKTLDQYFQNLNSLTDKLGGTAVAYYPKFASKVYPIFMLAGKFVNVRNLPISYDNLEIKIVKFQSALRDWKSERYQNLAKNINEILFLSNGKLLQKVSRVAVVADDKMRTLPFAALLNKDNRFLSESFGFYFIKFVSQVNRPIRASKIPFTHLTALYQPEVKNANENFEYTAVEVELIQNLFKSKVLIKEEYLLEKDVPLELKKSNIWHISLPMRWQPFQKFGLPVFLLRQDGKNERVVLAARWLSVKPQKDNLLFISNISWNDMVTSLGFSGYDYLYYLSQNSGFRTMIFSLNSSNKNSAILISAFYRKLRRNDAVTALREAQNRAMQRNRHPYFWAMFILSY